MPAVGMSGKNHEQRLDNGLSSVHDGHMTTNTKTSDRDAALAEAHETLVAEVAKITNDTDWRRWLDAMSKFHTYSWNNVMLAYAQCAARGMQPPTRLAGFKTWLSLNRGVRKGERGLRIYAPLTVKVKPGEKGYRPDGKATKIVGFRLVPVFDLQQTDGEPIPDAPTADMPEGDAPAGLWGAMVAHAASIGSTVRFANTGAADGDTNPVTRAIRVHERFNTPDAMGRACAILAHEIAHSVLHITTDDGDMYDYAGHRGIAETEAESVAYLVARHFGIAMGNSSFHYVAGWSKDADKVLRVGQRVQSTARKIIDGIGEI